LRRDGVKTVTSFSKAAMRVGASALLSGNIRED
jgi:hypothetical protein